MVLKSASNGVGGEPKTPGETVAEGQNSVKQIALQHQVKAIRT